MSTLAQMMSALVVGGRPIGPHVWWRALVTAVPGTYGYLSYQGIQMKNHAGGTSYVVGTGTGFADSTTSGYPASNAFDGTADYWLSAALSLPIFIGYEFAAAVTIGEIIFTTNDWDQTTYESGDYDDGSATITVQSSDDSTTGLDGTWFDEFSGSIARTGYLGESLYIDR